MLFSRDSSQPRDETHISYISCIGRQVLYHQSHLGSPIESVDSGKILSSDPNSQLGSSVIFRQITHHFLKKPSYGKYLNFLVIKKKKNWQLTATSTYDERAYMKPNLSLGTNINTCANLTKEMHETST